MIKGLLVYLSIMTFSLHLYNTMKTHVHDTTSMIHCLNVKAALITKGSLVLFPAECYVVRLIRVSQP